MSPTTLSTFHPSPKRKRVDSTLPVPQLNTQLHPPVSTLSTPKAGSTPEPDSPRVYAVAKQLKGMSIQAPPVLPLPIPPPTPTDTVMRKKPKLDAMEGVEQTNADANDSELHLLDQEKESLYAAFGIPQADGAREIPETPQPGPTPRTFEAVAQLPQPVVFHATQAQPPPTQSFTTKSGAKAKGRSSQAGARSRSRSPPPESIFWKDSEITGHLADPSVDPDDDGTGINGIGFRPTRAIAQARAEKRKKQLADYRARLAQEARAKRSERRHRGVGSAGARSREGTVDRDIPTSLPREPKRIVKFALPAEG